MLPKV